MITGKTYGICATFLYGNDLHSKEPSDGKFMALAGFGKYNINYTDFINLIYQKIELSDYPHALDILVKSNFRHLFGIAKFISKDAKDFAFSVNNFFVKKRLSDISNIIKNVDKRFDSMILVGGVSLNLDLNTEIYKSYKNKKIFIPPCCDDTGQSVGSVCLLINEILGIRTKILYPYLGEGKKYFKFSNIDIDAISNALINDAVVLIHNGKSEIGPRALGNRSFLARPDRIDLKIRLSENIKQRESYRPISPMVIKEKVFDYFTGPKSLPFMLFKYSVLSSVIKKVIGCVHVDGSARVQTVTRRQNKFIYDLILDFGKKTGNYVLLNTSLNLKGLPLSNSIQDSIHIYNKIDGPKCLVYNGKILFSNCNKELFIN